VNHIETDKIVSVVLIRVDFVHRFLAFQRRQVDSKITQEDLKFLLAQEPCRVAAAAAAAAAAATRGR